MLRTALIALLLMACAPAQHYATVELPPVRVHLYESSTPDGGCSIWGRDIYVSGRVIGGKFRPNLDVLADEMQHLLGIWHKGVYDPKHAIRRQEELFGR